jgi:hypothetical protein
MQNPELKAWLERTAMEAHEWAEKIEDSEALALHQREQCPIWYELIDLRQSAAQALSFFAEPTTPKVVGRWDSNLVEEISFRKTI